MRGAQITMQLTDRERRTMGARLVYLDGNGTPREGRPPLPDDATLTREYRDACEGRGRQNLSSKWRRHWQREAKRARALLFADDMPEGTRVRVTQIDAGEYMTSDDIDMHGAGPDITGSQGTVTGQGIDGEHWPYVTVTLEDGALAGETYDFSALEVEPVLNEDPPARLPRFIDGAGVWVNETGEAL